MAYEFRLPDIGEGVAEGEVVEWFVKEGETVREDAPLVSVLTDKANVEIPSPKAGKVVRIHAQVGEKVKVGSVLVTIDTGDGASASAPAAAAPEKAPMAPATTPSPPPKAGEATPSRILASPNVRRLAAESGIDLSRISGSGPGGRILETDLKAIPAAAGGASRGEVAPVESAPPHEATQPAPASSAESDRIAIRGVRRVIAEHMAESVHRAAHFTYVEEVDVTELVRARDRMAKHVEHDGVKLTYLPFIVRAVVAGLREYPWMNARMDDAKQELEVFHFQHIGIATAAPEGLVVPVVREAGKKSIAKLAQEIQELAEKARAGKLTRAEMTGGTFTITSLGALGGLLATPILNYPEVAILGVHKIARRPVCLPDGSVGSAHMMNLSVSRDHRVLDGIVGAQFMSVVRGHLEDPHLLFADLA